jgi:hypothetical protein
LWLYNLGKRYYHGIYHKNSKQWGTKQKTHVLKVLFYYNDIIQKFNRYRWFVFVHSLYIDLEWNIDGTGQTN